MPLSGKKKADGFLEKSSAFFLPEKRYWFYFFNYLKKNFLSILH